jgi:transposase InsO family protein
MFSADRLHIILSGWVTLPGNMPWKKNSDQEQRWGFVQIVMQGKLCLAELCRRSGISRKTAYKWIARYKESGRRGLRDQERSAHRLHNRPNNKWLNRIRRSRSQNPSWGAPKIHWVLKRRFGRIGLPSEPAIGRWLKNWGLTRGRRVRRRKGATMVRAVLQEARQPNDVWTVDFKGWFRTGDGTRVEPLTVRDLASRYILKFCLMPRQNVEAARLAFTGIFREYGMPQVIRVDNGSPFGSTGALGLTRLSAWWVKLGIRVEFIEPGHPEQNGAHEQMHRVYKAETLNPPAATVRAQKGRSRRWYWEYNYKRPHEALGMKVPGDYYRKSRRKMPERLKPWKYPVEWESRLVKGKGMIHLQGRPRFVGEAFEGERIGLKRMPPGKWEVYFGPCLAGELHDEDAGGIRAVVYQKKTR